MHWRCSEFLLESIVIHGLLSTIMRTGRIKGVSTGLLEVVGSFSVMCTVKEAYGAGTELQQKWRLMQL